ncbi:hypothetical protein JY651_36315 [Pyxidicoccus parkwayensis]|uniref:Lipoprotein n=1 Tax=Pyxidicoccus parkwayensis TaxID=2813578 RepID=A0ABX7NPE9_9BACT|nr:hypothetical protein [Pyxidicoccus parkwaysis]QSQ20660.1 hypothetical protein JY651_36315 [Pyxidicoccus parkwaysis]
MKSIRFSLLAAFALFAAACNVDPELADMESGESRTMEAQSRMVLPPAPISNYCPSSIPGPPAGLPTAPTPITNYTTTALYPTGSNLRSAFTVIVTDPANPSGSWLAFGFDVKAQRNVFYVSGQNTRELRLLLNKIATDIDNLEQDSGTDTGFTWGMTGQIGGPILPQPGVHEGAWRVAWNNAYQMNVYMQ